ncbi:MAG: molybdenum cofactor guanylyltransferase [Myxococcota bacterium]
MLGNVLAGGLSSRFGSDKAVHLVDGEPMAVRVARVLAEAGLAPRLVARAPRGLGLPELIEPDGPRHPLWGVAAALADGDGFFTPVDLVDLRVEQVRALLAARGRAKGQPLLGFFPASFREVALEAALAGRPVREVVTAEVDVGVVRNLNRKG